MTSPNTNSTTEAEKLKQLLQTPPGHHPLPLRSLKDIGTTRTWDYSLPTISKHRRFLARHNFASDESFLEILEKDVGKGLPYRILKHVGVFDNHNNNNNNNNSIVLFGGCLLDIIFQCEHNIKDFDLRLVGEEFMQNETLCVQTARAFVASIFDFFIQENKKIGMYIGRHLDDDTKESKYRLADIIVSRRRSTVTIQLPNNIGVFQLTFAPARNIQEMLAKCQPHCTRIAIRNGAVVLDEMARYCIESTCIVLDTASFVHYYIEKEKEDEEEDKNDAIDNDNTGGRTLASQMVRYIKYFSEKGFDIILPDLDMEKVPRRNLQYNVCEVLALPSLTVVYDDIKGNIIMAQRLELPPYLASKTQSGTPIGEYDAEPTTNVGTNVGEAVHFNLRCLVHDVYDSFKYVAQGERYEEVFDFVPSLTPRMVDKSYETVTDSLMMGTIPISKITGYFSVTPPHEVVQELIAMPLKRLVQSGKLPQSFVLDEKMLETLVHKETESLKS